MCSCLRSNEWAPWCSCSCRSYWIDCCRTLQRCWRPRCSSLYRQHFQIHSGMIASPGNPCWQIYFFAWHYLRYYLLISAYFTHPAGQLRGVCFAWPYSICCRLSTNFGHWSWRPSRAYYYNQEGFYYFCPSYLCACWWLDWSSSCNNLCSLGCHNCVVSSGLHLSFSSLLWWYTSNFRTRAFTINFLVFMLMCRFLSLVSIRLLIHLILHLVCFPLIF